MPVTAAIPLHLLEIAGMLESPSMTREHRGFGVLRGEWTVRPLFRGFSDPAPPKTHCFGKEGSCLRDRQGRMSCAEIEIVRRLKQPWRAGWISPYSGDPPTRWAQWTWSKAQAVSVIPDAYSRFRDWLEAQPRSDGMPDVIATNGADLVLLECKRQPIMTSRDTARPSQTGWIHEVLGGRRPLLSDMNFVVAYWVRLPAPTTPPRVPPEADQPGAIRLADRCSLRRLHRTIDAGHVPAGKSC